MFVSKGFNKAKILDPVLDNGFRLETIVEPQPTQNFKELRPERYEKESRHPVFLCARAAKEWGVSTLDSVERYSVETRSPELTFYAEHEF